MAISDTALDEGRLQEFVGRFAGDLGAALHQTTVAHRRQARPLRGDGRRRAASRRASSPRAPAPTSATCASGCARRPPAATSSTTPTASASS